MPPGSGSTDSPSPAAGGWAAPRPFSRRRSLWYGLTLPYAALRLVLATRTLLFWSILPIVLTLVLYVWVIGAVQDWAMAQIVSTLRAWGWDPGGWIVWTISLASQMVLILVGALTFAFTSTVVASPFNDVLAERTEAVAEPPLPPADSRGLRAQLRLVWIDLVKTVAATAAGLIALLFAWVPGLNLLSFLVVCLLVCFQYTSYPQTRRRERLGRGFAFLLRHVWACSGFGASVSLLYAIPVVSSFTLPLAVVGGTLLVARAQGGTGQTGPGQTGTGQTGTGQTGTVLARLR